MSTYPAAFDSTFPGFPYVDATEYLDQTHANAWVAAIQAIESTIGFGSGGTPASPLYSATYATTYSTVTARIAALEGKVTGGLKLNTANSNTQSVSTVNLAGSTGLAADAGHVHASTVAAGSQKQIGEVFMWPGAPSSFPAGCLQCNGQLVSTSTYSTLFTILSYTYGGSGGSFGLPNFNDRFPIGVNATAPSAGSTGGSRTITTNNMPTHNHTAGDNGHFHGIPSGYSGFGFVVGQLGYTGTWAAAANGSQYGGSGLGLQVSNPSTSTASANVTTNNAGSGTNYDQPFLGIYFLIRAA